MTPVGDARTVGKVRLATGEPVVPRTLIAIGMTLTLASVGVHVHVHGAAAQEADTGSTRPVAELPVSLERMQRRIDKIARAGDDAILLRLTSYVDVFARAPGIALFRPTFDLELGPIPYGAPTHAEMIAAMTPRQWRPPLVRLDGVVGLTMRSLNSPR